MKWYEAAVNMAGVDECGEFDATMDDPVYELQAKMAEMYFEGGYGLDRNPSYAGKFSTEKMCACVRVFVHTPACMHVGVCA